MLKKFISSILIFSSIQTYANGMYVGVGVGRDTANFKKNLQIGDAESKDINYYKSDNQPGHGFLSDFFVGHQWEHKKFYLATELNFALSSLKYNGYFSDYKNNETSKADYQIDKSYGVSLLPGYRIENHLLLYGRIGIVRGHFKYSEYKGKAFSSEDRGITEWQWLNGFRYGVGIAGFFNENFGLRLEYNHISYQTHTNTSFPLAIGSDRTIKLTPSTDQVVLSLFYNFV